jgi:hypothetical protein
MARRAEWTASRLSSASWLVLVFIDETAEKGLAIRIDETKLKPRSGGSRLSSVGTRRRIRYGSWDG